MFLLDTNVCIHLLNNAAPSIEQRFREHTPDQIALCSIVKAELLYGAQRSSRVDANLQRLKTFFSPLRSLLFDDDCAHHYGLIRADLAAQGAPIGPNDLLIAAIARANNAILVTHNVKKFSRVAGLEIEDWQTK